MDEQISALTRTIQDEIDLYRDLIEHAKEKTRLLVQGRLEPILESNKADETFNVKLRILEDELIRLCRRLSLSLNISREEFTLMKLAEALQPKAAEEIKNQCLIFKNLVDQLKKVNKCNMRLVEGSVHYSRGLLDFISNATSSYRNNGLFKPCSAVQSTISSKA